MEDFLLLDEGLAPEERVLRDSLRRFVEDEIIDRMPEAYEAGEFPKAFIGALKEMRVFGMTLPEEYGGAGASFVAQGLTCQELERGDSGLRSFMSVQSSLCMYPIFRYGSEEQKRQYLPAMADGDVLGCFGLTEPDVGSNPSEMKTRATKVKGGWEISGSKLWITNATIANIAIVWAMTEEGIRGFIVDTKSKGFTANEIKRKMSLRASITGELVLQKVFVPDDHYLPGSDRGLGAPLSCLNKARYGISWGAMGAAMFCYETALQYAKERKQFNQPIAKFQLIQKDLVDMFTEIQKARCLNLQVGRLMDTEQATPIMVSMAKMNGCREALKIARMARNILGANGISLEYGVIRHMNNLESVFTYEGTDNVHHLIIGQHITGLNAFS